MTTPCCRIGAITATERASVLQRSPVGATCDHAVNRESAAELLLARAAAKAAPVGSAAPAGTEPSASASAGGSAWGTIMHDALFGTERRQGMVETMGKQVMRTMGSQIGRQIMRGVLRGIFGGKR